MEQIAATFADHFRNWNIELPTDSLASRQQGEIRQARWIIEYLFGSEADEEYLDYYASHAMTNDRHVRIYADGRSESLEALSEMWAYSKDATEAERQKAHEDFLERNDSIRAMLAEKGFKRFQRTEGEETLSPRERRELIEKRKEATRIFHETRDATPAEDAGLFPPKPRRLWSYRGFVFHVSRTSEDAAYIGLRSDSHGFHSVYIVGLSEDEKALYVGRPSSESPPRRVYSFEEGLELGANMLIRECGVSEGQFRKQLDEFFVPENLSNAAEVDKETKE